MANLIKATVTKVEGSLNCPLGTVYLNSARIDGIKIYGTTGAQFVYLSNQHGIKDKYSRIYVSETVAATAAACESVAPFKRISASVLARGGNVLAAAETESIRLQSILMAYADPTAPTTKCVVWIQNASWGAAPFSINSSIQAFVNLTKNTTLASVTKVFTIGWSGSTVDDAVVTSVANTTAQNIKITAALPAFAVMQNWTLISTAAWTGATALGTTIGTASAGTQIVTSTDMVAANALVSGGAGLSPYLAASASATDFYVGITPTANFNLITAGQLKLVYTYIDNANA